MTSFAASVAMVRPASFGYNEETAATNFFQQNNLKHTSLQQKALEQFDSLVQLLRTHGIEVLVLDDNEAVQKPDAVFPNNWFTCNHNKLVLFPMEAISRRREKDPDLIEQLKKYTAIDHVLDLSAYEDQHKFLEGTGSMVFDHQHKIVYACLSTRTDKGLLDEHAASLNYQAVCFTAEDDAGKPVYHTNVMLCIGNGFAIICSDAITDLSEKEKVLASLNNTNYEIIEISFQQLKQFAGNALQLLNKQGQYKLFMSAAALHSLSSDQLKAIEKYTEIVPANVSVIESASGGSVRCMLAELYL